MAEKKDSHWMEKAFENAHGQLRKTTGAKPGEPIPAKKLAKAEHSSNPTTKKRAVLAETARKVNE
jgi:hypothetical protein